MEVTLALMCSATCDPYYALLPLVHFICVFVQRGNPEERAAGGKNENVHALDFATNLEPKWQQAQGCGRNLVRSIYNVPTPV